MENYTFNFVLGATAAEASKNELEMLNEVLGFCGVYAKITTESGSSILTIKINSDKLRKVKTRGAGRNRVENEHACKVAEVKEWISNKVPLSEILEKLGMTQATYYRRLKEHKESGVYDNPRRAAKKIF